MARKVPLQDGSSLYNINPRLDTINPLLGHSCTLVVYIEEGAQCYYLCESTTYWTLHVWDHNDFVITDTLIGNHLKQADNILSDYIGLDQQNNLLQLFTAYKTLLIVRRVLTEASIMRMPLQTLLFISNSACNVDCSWLEWVEIEEEFN